MTFPFCPECETSHAAGACDLVAAFRDPDQPAEYPTCTYGFDMCDDPATHTVTVIRPDGFRKIRDLCDFHTMEAAVGLAPGWTAESTRLPDPADPKVAQ